MSSPGITVRGGAELAKMFGQLADDAKGQILESATQSGALIVLNQVRRTVNEGGNTPYLTGTYRRSFHMETTTKTPTRCVVTIGTDAPQARRLEYGFVGRDNLGRVYNQAARPHIRPALDENRRSVSTEIVDAIRSGMFRRIA